MQLRNYIVSSDHLYLLPGSKDTHHVGNPQNPNWSLKYLIPLETLVCPGNNVLQERGVFSSTLALASPARAQKSRPSSLPQAL